MARVNPETGIIVLDQKFLDKTNLTANTAGALTSDYQQSGSEPGIVSVVSGQSLVPVVSNAQSSDDLVLTINQTGYSGKVAATFDIGTTEVGHLLPLSVHGYTPISWGTAIVSAFGACVKRSTQDIYVAYATYSSSFTKFSHSSSTWSSPTTIASSANRALAIVMSPDEKMLIAISLTGADKLRTHYSIDEGATWNLLSNTNSINLTAPTTCNKLFACYINNNIVAVASDGTTCYQYASSDSGLSFELVDSFSAASFSISEKPDGIGALITLVQTATIYCAFLPSAYTPISSLSKLEIDSATYATCCCDYDGLLNIFGNTTSTLSRWYSRDGKNWGPGFSTGSAGDVVYTTSDVSTHITEPMVCIASRGSIYLLSNHVASPGTQDGSLSMLKLGSWSNIEWDAAPTHTYLPFDLPNNTGVDWGATGTAGTLSSTGYLNIDTSSATGYYTWDNGVRSLTPGVHCMLNIETGGSTTGNDVVINLKSCNTTDTYYCRIRFSQTAMAIFDVSGGGLLLDTITYSSTENVEIFMCFISEGVLLLGYKRPNEPNFTINTYSGIGSTGAGSTEYQVIFGHFASISAITNWGFITIYEDVNAGFGSLTTSNLVGKTLTSLPYPLPIMDTDGYCQMLSIGGGIGYVNEEYTIPPNYIYPIDNVFAGLSPSPMQEWRSTDTSEQILSFNFGKQVDIGNAIGVIVQNTNIKTMYLEYYDGAAWQVAGTYNGAIAESVDFDRTGNVLTPTSATDAINRMIVGSELASGSWVNLSSADQRYVSENTQGFWAPSGSVRISFDGLDGTEASTDVMDLISDGGVLIVYSNLIKQRWRIRIPTQDCPDAFFKAGLIGIGPFIPFGRPWDWGRSENIEPAYDTFTNQAGTEFRNKLSEPITTWTISFADGLDNGHVRGYGSVNASYSPDYVGITGGATLAIRNSNYSQLVDILKRSESMTTPVVAIADVPTSTGMITDRTKYLYGYLTGSIATSHIAGSWGTNEIIRIEAIQVKGIV